MNQGNVHIGLSGWSYSYWKGSFYPEKMQSADFLPHYALTYNTGEINSSFYHLPRPTTIEGWMAKVPTTFKFCAKMSRYVTHIKRMKEPEEPLERFFKVFEPMKK